VLYLQLIILSVRGDVPIDSETLLLTDFMNLKIKPTQFFKDTHRGMMCMCMFIVVSAHTCINIYVYTIFLKKSLSITKSHHEKIRSPKLEESGSWEAAVVREYNVENAVTVKQDSVHDTTDTTRQARHDTTPVCVML
jgi:hypothetical protein